MTLFIGFLLPALIGTVNKHVTNSSARFWISTLIAAVVGIAVNFLEHNGLLGYNTLSPLEIANSLAESIMAMVGMVKLSFEAVWNNESLGKKLPNTNETILERLDLKKV